MEKQIRVGLDIGSTTLKAVVLDETGELLYEKYERHYSMITEKAAEMLRDIADTVGADQVLFAISGSAGMGLADRLGLAFQQEVYATRHAVESVLGEVCLLYTSVHERRRTVRGDINEKAQEDTCR